MDDTKRLSDFGEFRLLREIVFPAVGQSECASEVGDDCAIVRLPNYNRRLVVTADAAPRPLAWCLGHQSYRTWGWYAVIVNVSDLASAGADPVAFVTSIDAPPEMSVADFREFFEGMADACSEFGLPNVGGNLRAAERFACHGMAMGSVCAGGDLGRSGCVPGDRLTAIGKCGHFAQAYLRAKSVGIECLAADDRQWLIRPQPVLREMALLAGKGYVSAASDNSDGVLGALWSIAERSGCGIELSLDESTIPASVRQTAVNSGLSPWNLMFTWGDWQVIASIHLRHWEEFVEFAEAEGIPFTPLGRATKGAPELYGLAGGCRRAIRVVRSENFMKNSFNAGAAANFEHMLHTAILADA